MYLLKLLSCLLIVVVSGTVAVNIEKLPKLIWPAKYTFEAEKISLTAGLVEDIQYWRTGTKSRVDYNKGAVKTFHKKALLKSKFFFGVKYEVHPETTEDGENHLVCTRTNGTLFSKIVLEDILPDTDEFKHVGSEVLDRNKVERFYSSEVDSDYDTRQTLWVNYNLKNKTWTPIRYEKVQYYMWLHSKKSHEIWNFHNFYTDFKSSEVFNFESTYDCEDSETDADEINKPLSPNNNLEADSNVDRLFNSFKENHNRVYADQNEHALRRNLFKKRMRLVVENNSKSTGYKLTINQFADRTPEEMKKHMGLLRPSQRESDTHPFPYTTNEVKELASNLPDEFDLRDIGVITPAIDQKECGSCWTFGTTAAVEGALARKNGGRLLRLSNQALIDCSWSFGLSGCDGGYDIAAYRWIMEYGLPTEEEYGPYADQDGFCHIHNMTEVYRIRGFTNVTPYSVEALKVAVVNHGPLSVSIHATDSLTLYQGGIFYDVECDPEILNHEVTLVGYGQRDGEEYWVVKNSWGQNWGVDGYFYMSVRAFKCGITTEPTYPVL